jgi:hypothetical protein
VNLHFRLNLLPPSPARNHVGTTKARYPTTTNSEKFVADAVRKNIIVGATWEGGLASSPLFTERDLVGSLQLAK